MMPVTAPPRIEHGARHRSHQADRAAAIDEADAGFGHRPPEDARGLRVDGVARRAPEPQ